MTCFTFSNILIKFTDIIKIEKWEGIRNNSLLRTLNSMQKKKKKTTTIRPSGGGAHL